jgi:sec-independent protein translocase protein TatA
MIQSILLFFGSLGGWEILLILFVVLLLFGAKKIPELARGLGKGIREFKDATSGIKDELERSVNEDPKRS